MVLAMVTGMYQNGSAYGHTVLERFCLWSLVSFKMVLTMVSIKY